MEIPRSFDASLRALTFVHVKGCGLWMWNVAVLIQIAYEEIFYTKAREALYTTMR